VSNTFSSLSELTINMLIFRKYPITTKTIAFQLSLERKRNIWYFYYIRQVYLLELFSVNELQG